MAKVYSIKEAAEILGKHVETIERWFHLGELPKIFRNNDKEGGGISENDLLNLNKVVVFIWKK